MKSEPRESAIVLVLLAACLTVGRGQAQQAETREPAGRDALTCSPAPCVLPPTEASEGGSIVTDPIVVTDPANTRNLLLGSFDANCGPPSFAGFHLSTDAGSTWKRVWCSPVIHEGDGVYDPGSPGLVGYDRNGVAFAAADYGDSEGLGYGFAAVQKSADGTRWGRPVIALP